MAGRGPDDLADPFATAAIRTRVLQTWAASPERLREDANSEDDLVHGGYRDRLVVELAQNAADAALAAGVAGRLLLRLERGAGGPRLVAANTGAPLTADGVLALATLRASAKRDADAATGRFGVGFAAVLAVSDDPALISRTGGVYFSRAHTVAAVRAAAAGLPALAAELDRRHDHVPVLRLPFAVPGRDPLGGAAGEVSAVLPDGYDTAVVLPLRDAAADAGVADLLDAVDDALLLTLPALTEIRVETPGAPARVLAEVGRRWFLHTVTGLHDPRDLAALPVEDRGRSGFTISWALPTRTPATWSPVVHAPTPTTEPLPWPAMLIADLPLEPDRRTIQPGPATDAVLDLAAEALAGLAERLARHEVGGTAVDMLPLDLLPDPAAALPAGWFDAALRERALAALRGAAVLTPAGGGAPLRPDRAVVLDGPGSTDPILHAVLGARTDRLVAAPPRHAAVLRQLDVVRLEVAEALHAVATPEDLDGWRDWLRALAPAAAGDPAVREALATLSVPVLVGAAPHDGEPEPTSSTPSTGPELRIVAGVRGVLLVDHVRPATLVQLAGLGLRVVPSELAADPVAGDLLIRLGARRVGPGEVLSDPALAAAVTRADARQPDQDRTSGAVLDLVEDCLGLGLDPSDLDGVRWLADLPLPDSEGDLVPASMLVQPGSPMADLLEEDAAGRLADEPARRWSSEVFQAVGVAARPVLVRAEDVEPEEVVGQWADLDGVAEWAARLVETAGSAAAAGSAADRLGVRVVGELLAVRDLDLVEPDRLGELVALLLAEPGTRRALVDPVRLARPDGTAVPLHPSYTAWWLRAEIGGVSAGSTTDPDLAAVLPTAPPWLDRMDAQAAAALGRVQVWADLDPAGWAQVLRRLGHADLAPPLPTLLRLWTVLADSPGPPAEDGDPLWALAGTRVVRCNDPAVADGAQWLQRADVGPYLVVAPDRAAALARRLDLDLASERAPGRVSSAGRPSEVPQALLATWPALPRQWWEHEDLQVDAQPVEWWVERTEQQADHGGAEVHAATLDGLARALAVAAGAWPARHTIAAVLAGHDPTALLVDDAFG